MSFMVFAGWAYVLALLGIIFNWPAATSVGTVVILFWAGPFTPLIPIVLLVAFLIQRYVFRDRSNDEALKEAIDNFKEHGFSSETDRIAAFRYKLAVFSYSKYKYILMDDARRREKDLEIKGRKQREQKREAEKRRKELEKQQKSK